MMIGKPQKHLKRGLLLSVLMASLLLAGVWVHSQKAAKDLILFYDPDANHEAIVQISVWFNQFLHASDVELEFKPVQSQKVFDRLIKGPNVQYVIVSSGQLNKITSKTLVPLLVPSKNGSVYYRKVLLNRDKANRLDFSNQTIATTITSGNFIHYSHLIREKLKKAGLIADKARFLSVSKDIDALLALAFGRVQAAVVTRGSMDMLRRISPVSADQMNVVLEMEKQLRAPLCRVGNSPDVEIEKQLLRALKYMGNDETGRKALSTLGFDSWVDFKPGMIVSGTQNEK